MSNRLVSSSEPPPHASVETAQKHKIDWKVAALGVLCEGGISGGIFYGAWENAELFAASNPVFMLLAPFLCVVLEFTKVPVGLISQTHPSLMKRGLAVLLLLAATMSTAINAVPIFAKMWKPQLVLVQQGAENLAVAEANQASFNRQMQDAKDAVTQAQAVLKDAQDSRRTASSGVGKLARKHDNRTVSLQTDLADARKDVAAEAKKLDAASKALGKFDPKPSEDAVKDAATALRKARQASTLHWIYGAATGAEIASISDARLAPLMIGAVGLPAILVAMVSSLLAALAVTAIKSKAVGSSARGLLRLIKATRAETVDSAVGQVVEEAKRLFAQEAEAEAAAKREAADAATVKAFQKIVAADTTATRQPAKPEPRKLAPRRSAKKAAASRAAPNDARNVVALKAKDQLS